MNQKAFAQAYAQYVFGLNVFWGAHVEPSREHVLAWLAQRTPSNQSARDWIIYRHANTKERAISLAIQRANEMLADRG
jgi:hypothetical protein